MHVFAYMYVHMPRACQRSEEGVRAAGTGVIDGYVGAENGMWVLCKSSKCSQPLDHLSSVLDKILNLFKTK